MFLRRMYILFVVSIGIHQTIDGMERSVEKHYVLPSAHFRPAQNPKLPFIWKPNPDAQFKKTHTPIRAQESRSTLQQNIHIQNELEDELSRLALDIVYAHQVSAQLLETYKDALALCTQGRYLISEIQGITPTTIDVFSTRSKKPE